MVKLINCLFKQTNKKDNQTKLTNKICAALSQITGGFVAKQNKNTANNCELTPMLLLSVVNDTFCKLTCSLNLICSHDVVNCMSLAEF